MIFKVLILVCSLGLTDADCKNGRKLATIEGPSFYGSIQCEIAGHFIIANPETNGIDVSSPTDEPSYLRHKSVEEGGL